jgi:hypothetical protein
VFSGDDIPEQKGGKSVVDSALTLKRVRDLDVGEAKAEWRVEEGVIVIHA